tara:strand:+ start:1160 stop:1390 length:231 start_codon:yes stop_codon:yes gene_type:complete
MAEWNAGQQSSAHNLCLHSAASPMRRRFHAILATTLDALWLRSKTGGGALGPACCRRVRKVSKDIGTFQHAGPGRY